MLISYDTINFQWETEGDKKRLVIFLDNIGEVKETDKSLIEGEIFHAIKMAVNN